jgi:hypothetical protein
LLLKKEAVMFLDRRNMEVKPTDIKLISLQEGLNLKCLQTLMRMLVPLKV